MGLTSLEVCMDSSDWLQGVVHEERAVDSSSSPGEMITCSRPLLERKLRPQHDQALKCPRCDSTHTKFCYYNNYSLSQPRYFCKTCRRYWTKGGSLRNVPVGGGCRKNKKVAAKKQADQTPNKLHNASLDATDLHLSFPGVQLSQFNTFLGNPGSSNLMECKFDNVIGNPIETKFDAILGTQRYFGFISGSDADHSGGLGDVGHGFSSSGFNGVCSPFGFSMDGNHGSFVDGGERLSLPFGTSEDPNSVEKKPNNRPLALEWQEQGCSGGYMMNGIGSWSGAMNGYGSSAENALV